MDGRTPGDRPATAMPPVPEGSGRRATTCLAGAAIAVLGLLISSPLAAEVRAGIEWDGWERALTPLPITSAPIEVDARLDEPAWAAAATIELEYEIDPGENSRPPVRTVALVTHDRERLYVAFRAHDPDPAKIRAVLADRDTPFDDDFVGIMVDTFADERNAYEFFVNPLGVQMDLTRDDLAGGQEDSAWDALWDSAGRITEEGFVVEMAIPFRAMRFPATGGTQTWGLALFRSYPRGVRHQITDFPMDPDRNCFLCQVNQVSGFEGISPGRNLEVNPTVVSNRADLIDGTTGGGGGELVDGDFETEAGVNVTWGVTPNFTLAGTVNPDFSQVEADAGQLDINNQFALFFPEQRPFFLEGADIFRTPFDAVFTRNVADPEWGVKGTGKVGPGTVGLFVAQDAVTNLLIPGSQGSATAVLDRPTTDAVARYRQDVGETSAIGVLYTGREGGDYSNHVAGVDGRFQFRDSHTVSFQALGSTTRYPGELARSENQPEGSFDDHAWRLRYNYGDREWGGYAQVEHRGPGFRADMGFVPRVGYDFVLAGGQRRWIGSEENRWSRLSVGGDFDLTRDTDGTVLERESEIWGQIDGPLQSVFWAGAGVRDLSFDALELSDAPFWNIYGSIRPSGAVQLEVEAGTSETFDYANTRPGDAVYLAPALVVKAGRQLSFRLSHSLRRLDVDGGRLFAANLSELRGVYQINLRTFVRATFQYTDISRDPALYRSDVDAETEALFSQLLFSYKLNPRTVLFLGYSDDRSGGVVDGLDRDLTQDGRSLFLKIGYAWVA